MSTVNKKKKKACPPVELTIPKLQLYHKEIILDAHRALTKTMFADALLIGEKNWKE